MEALVGHTFGINPLRLSDDELVELYCHYEWLKENETLTINSVNLGQKE